MRLSHQGPKQIKKIKDWGVPNQIFISMDDLFIAIGLDEGLCQKVLKLDSSPDRHAKELGSLLGYPECCCHFAEKVKEENIDAIEKTRKGLYKEEFKLIDTFDYMRGKALISHLPCTLTCTPSLLIARKTLKFLKEHSYIPYFKELLDCFNGENKSIFSLT